MFVISPEGNVRHSIRWNYSVGTSEGHTWHSGARVDGSQRGEEMKGSLGVGWGDVWTWGRDGSEDPEVREHSESSMLGVWSPVTFSSTLESALLWGHGHSKVSKSHDIPKK